MNKVSALWKYSEWWASRRKISFQKKFFKTLYTFKHTIEQRMRSVKVQWVVGFNQKQWFSEEVFQNFLHIQTNNWTMYALCGSTLSSGLQAEVMAFRRSFSKHYTYSNIQLNKVCALWRYTEWWASSRSNSFQKKFFKNNLHIQTYNCTKYALCRSTLSGGLQAEAMAFRIIFSKQYEHSKIQLNKVWALWKYSEWWASSSSNGFQRKFLKTLYTFKHTFEQYMRSVKVHWVVGFKQKQWFSEEVFQNIIHTQTNNWTKYALCESTVSGGLQVEAMAFRRSFSKQFIHSNIQLNKLGALWKYSELWASSRSNGFQKKFFKTIYTFKLTIEQSMRSVKVLWVMGFKEKEWLSEEGFQDITNIQTYNWTK